MNFKTLFEAITLFFIVLLYSFTLYLVIVINQTHLIIHAAFNTNCADTATTGIPETECNALKDLYNHTDGDHWINNTNWGTNSNVGTWYGVTTTNGHVSTLDLRINNLNGVIPSSIGNLPNIETLYLYRNHLSGQIPDEIGNLTNLRFLAIDTNNLSGPIPSTLGELQNIEVIHLQNNRLTGTIPDELGNLTTLQELDLSINHLSGPIPAALNNLLHLTALSIRDNNYTFNELEPFLNNTSIQVIYTPQKKVGAAHTYALQNGESITLSVDIPENPTGHDQYQWYKDGQAISGATHRTYTVTINSSSDYGTYTYKITNSSITNLTLESNPIVITQDTNTNPPTPPPTGTLGASPIVILTGLLSTILIVSFKNRSHKT